ncbi:MAG: hypothetical protein AAFW46_17180 [Pseudomonadota bacterium]
MNEALSDGPIAVGRRVEAVFPKMAGKIRPGVVVAIGAGPVGGRTVAAVPMTTRRTNQAGRFAASPDPDGGWRRRSWLLIPMCALFPERRILALRAPMPEEEREAVLAGMAAWHGADWARRERGLLGPIQTPRVLDLGAVSRADRRARARSWGGPGGGSGPGGWS